MAYRSALRELVAAGVVDSVGDGLFEREHHGDRRAAAFWFMFAAPMLALMGELVERADRTGDGDALVAAGWSVLGLGGVGLAVIPRSGFPLTLPMAGWLLRRGNVLRGR